MILPESVELADWVGEARCAGLDVDRMGAVELTRICFTCPVQRECATFAIETSETGRVWGGLSDIYRGRVRNGISTLDQAFAQVKKNMRLSVVFR